jgi:tetraacyldisaccharide 4'-kinase
MLLARWYRVWNWQLKRRLARAEVHLSELLYGKKPPRGRMWLVAGLLRIFEGIFRLIVRVRVWLYAHRLLKQNFLGCQVIVIGNLTVGGTGKTPIVERLARALSERGRRVAILSRGYKREEIGWLKKLLALFDPALLQPTLVSNGKGKLFCDWRRAGDEPYMLARNLPDVAVVVDKNRVKGGAFAIRKLGVDTLILDDGFQYYPLKSRMNLLLIDQTNPFGSGAMLPRGILREPIRAMRRANYVFITKSDGHPSPKLLETIRKYHPGLDPILCTHKPQRLVCLTGGPDLELEALQGADIVAFSGIAVPESFENELRRRGANVVKAHRFADHYAYEPEDIEQVVSSAVKAGVRMIVTTEKDAVRLDAVSSLVPLYFLRMEVEILGGQGSFDSALAEICKHEKTQPFI